MATTLLGGLVARFLADGDLRTLVPAGVWVGDVPEEQALPIVVLDHMGEVPEWTTEKDYLETGQVQFRVFNKGLASVEAIADQIKATFDWCSLNIQNAASIWVQRTNYLVEAVEVRAPDGEIVYQATISYETKVRKTLA